MSLPLKERCRGKWFGILTGLGVDPSFLRNKHGPCPTCGGRDRFRWDDKNGDGSWFCNQCEPHAGDGIALVMKMRGLDFHPAALLIESLIGSAPAPSKPVPTRTPAKGKEPLPDIENHDLWKFSRPVTRNDVTDRWLRNRGLEMDVFPAALHTHASVMQSRDPRTFGPAMIALVRGPDGRPVSIHRTFLTADGEKANVAPQRSFITGPVLAGSAVWLMKPGPKLGIAEGIETALACMKLFSLPTWAALSAGGIERFIPPASVETLLIMADNDDNGTGRRAAEKLAGRLSIKCEIHLPSRGESDFNDVWRSARK